MASPTHYEPERWPAADLMAISFGFWVNFSKQVKLAKTGDLRQSVLSAWCTLGMGVILWGVSSLYVTLLLS